MDFDVVIIGSGFGGTMTALTIAERLKTRNLKLRILERGTWWTTPLSTIQDKDITAPDLLKKHSQPVQFWPSVDHFKGFIDIVLRCVRRPKNEDGLYEFTQLGKRGFFGIGRENDGVTILRACGVGGGSLVYSNITIRPPNFIFEDDRWKALGWSDDERTQYYQLARHAIGYGVVSAWNEFEHGNIPYKNIDLSPQPTGAVNAGLSNIVTRSARLDPQWHRPAATDPKDGRLIRQIDVNNAQRNALWIDRARVFQSAISNLTKDFGTVDSSINDLTPEGSALNPQDPFNYPLPQAINYCERQGRCNVGCLPGARHTLNKQLMAAAIRPKDPTNPNSGPLFPNISIEALSEVDVIRPLDGGGYEIEYWQRDELDPAKKKPTKITATRVIVAAGCVGTNEIILRSKNRGTLPNLSDKAGFGFSTNGDYIAFLEGLDKPISLTRGPVTTSFGHFNTPEADPNADTKKFHIVEDQGVPRAIASTIGFGVPLIRSLSNGRGHQPWILTTWVLLLWAWNRLTKYIAAIFNDFRERQEAFISEDEYTQKMMCVVAQGREASVGQFRLGKGAGETSLHVKRADGLQFIDDPIFKEIEASLDRLAIELKSTKKFINPFLSEPAGTLAGQSVTISHPLGGCRIGKSADDGVVDEFGRVFDKNKSGERPFYEGLHIADAAIIPAALGVNPSLTICALALRIADKIVKEIEAGS